MIQMQLTDILMDLLSDEHPWEGNIKGLVERLVDNGVTIQKWISVKDRLPEYGVPVLVADTRDGFVSMFSLEKRPNNKSYWFNGEDWWLDQEEITHWMPLPQPPKEEEE